MMSFTISLADITINDGELFATVNSSESGFGVIKNSQLFIASKLPVSIDSFDTQTRVLTLSEAWLQGDVVNAPARITPNAANGSLSESLNQNQQLMSLLLEMLNRDAGNYVSLDALDINASVATGAIVAVADLSSATFAINAETTTALPGDIAFSNGKVGRLVTRGEIIPEQLHSPSANAITTALARQAAAKEVISLRAETYEAGDWSTVTSTHKVSIKSLNKSKIRCTNVERDFLHCSGAIELDNIMFEGFRDVVVIPEAAPDIDLVSITNCKFSNVRYAGQRELTWKTVPSRIAKIVIKHNEINNKALYDAGLFSKGFVFFGPFTSVDCGHNEMRWLGGSALEFANDAYETQDDMENIHVYHNTIEHIYDPRDTVDGCNGIDVRGRKATVADNIITDIANYKADDCEGIYTKIRFGRVAGNILTDAGTEEGFIAIKGNDRSSIAAPGGYNIEVCNNTLVGARANTTGLFISASDVNAHDNTFEGFTHHCIKLDDVYERNVWVHRNNIIEPLCAIAITSTMCGEGIAIEHNRCFGIGNQVSLKDFFFVKFGTYKGDIDDVQITGNQLHLHKSVDYAFVTGAVTTLWFVASDRNDLGAVDIKDNELKLAQSNFPHIRSKVVRLDGSRANADSVTIDKNYTDANVKEASLYKLELTPSSCTGVNTEKLYGVMEKRYLQHSDSGCVVRNSDASGTSTVYLPTAIPGVEYTATNSHTSNLEFRLQPKETEGFRGTATGAFLFSSTVRAALKVKCIEAGIWDVISQAGTWQEALPEPAPSDISTLDRTTLVVEDNGARVTNTGVGVDRAVNLPSAIVGLIFHFENTSIEPNAPHELRVRPDATDRINGLNLGRYFYAPYLGARMTLECVQTGVWSLADIEGDWYREGETPAAPSAQASVIYTAERTALTLYDNGATVTNEGLQVDRAANLPEAIRGLEFYFRSVAYKANGDPVEMRVRPDTNDTVRGYTMEDYLYFETLDPFAEILMECNEDGVWDVIIFNAVVQTR
ncbi:hypothetical protein [Alteromonas sp. KUL49]|uniref:hypothetical protein n=1 Tax=Alteromonas sp. KUL49 TaxID=2480798 RepID=UPI00102F0DDD|nr:hypothetical protein [Alteromonas sp. KUL49]TAP38719.1 hypothetical protein EYS00_15060 [Alteromonas sp. KUL49]GEA12673.1 hypothetical protein KUL49_30480 [Alteromonas sp. KUL49]